MTMTRKDAIKTLRELWRETNNPWYEEVYNMAIEALQAKPTHGRLIDADALMEYCSNQKSKTINNNDIARFPTVQIADKPHGEWIEEYADANGDKWYRCSHCGERFVLIEKGEASTEPYHFCPNCEADMRQNK